ncbi:MAG: hypothetical protein K2Q45_08475 [Nitrosomonas sp.]|nr:hypothetical protein [Nitrosomonas sp.]
MIDCINQTNKTASALRRRVGAFDQAETDACPLEIIKWLLSEDGSLWITIDDNKAHYLKVI